MGSDASKNPPAYYLTTDSMVQGNSEVAVATQLDGPSLLRDNGRSESHEGTKADESDDGTATSTDREHDTNDTAKPDAQSVKANNQDLPLESQAMVEPIKQVNALTPSNDQLLAKLKDIYAKLSVVQDQCEELDLAEMHPRDGLLDITRYLSILPNSMLMLLQNIQTRLDDTIRTWYIKAHKDATDGDKKPLTIESTRNFPATCDDSSTAADTRSMNTTDSPAASEEARDHPHVSEKTASQVGSSEDLLHGFMVALEQCAMKHGWSEYEGIAAVTTAEIGEEGRQKVIEEKRFLIIGHELVEQILRDLQFAKEKAEKKAASTVIGVASSSGLESLSSSSAPDKRPKTELPTLVEFRRLSDQSLYKRFGRDYYVFAGSQWIRSLNGEKMSALFAVHRTLLHEYYAFFLVSQHPSATEELKMLAAKYAMPARMWRHAVCPLLEIFCTRLVESKEFMDGYIIEAYSMMSLLQETVPRFHNTWVECKADLARYGMVTQSDDRQATQHWHDIPKEHYTQVQSENPVDGRIYYQLAMMARPQIRLSPDEAFDAAVSQLFYHTKSLMVKTPYFAGRRSLLSVIQPIVTRNEEGVPQTDKDHFLTAVSHLILASLEPETLRGNGYKERRNDHVQAVYTALENIKIGATAKTSRISPSPQLGLLLCQLLLGIPLVDQRWSPMMTAWAPGLVTAEDRADSDAMANARDVHDVTVELIHTMIPCLLEDVDTRDLKVWGFIYVILVFMRSMKTRPSLLEWLGSAFHPHVLASFLNMLLREDETRGDAASKSASHSELVTIWSPLNERKKPDKYGFSTEDSIKKFLCAKEECTAPGGETTVEEAMAIDTTHDRDSERGYANVLPEHNLLVGHFFARQAGLEPRDKSQENPTENALAVACPPAPEPTPATVQAVEETIVDQAHKVSRTYSEPDNEREHEFLAVPESEGKAQKGRQMKRKALEAPPAEVQVKEAEAVDVSLEEVERKESQNEDTRQQDALTKEVEAKKAEEGAKQKPREAEKARLAEEARKKKEAEEAEVRNLEGRLRDPPLFLGDWFKNSKYDYHEMQVHNYVQSAEMHYDRSIQILCLAYQLKGHFFVFEIDEEGRHWTGVPGASSIPKPDPNKKMPEIIERDGGARVVYVHPSFHAAEIEREMKRIAREKRRQKEKEEAKTNTDVFTITYVHEKAEGDAEMVITAKNIPEASLTTDATEQQLAHSEKPISHEAPDATAVASVMVSDDGDSDLISALNTQLDTATRFGTSTTAADELLSIHGTEHTETKVEAVLPMRGVKDSKDTKGSNTDPDTAVASTVVAEKTATEPQATVQLSKEMLDNLPRVQNRFKAIELWRDGVRS